MSIGENVIDAGPVAMIENDPVVAVAYVVTTKIYCVRVSKTLENPNWLLPALSSSLSKRFVLIEVELKVLLYK